MPIHLRPTSRRRFLAGLAIAGAGMALPGRVWAQSRVPEVTSWALLSDTHIAADRAMVNQGVNMTDHLNLVVRQVLELPQQPAGLILNGDCAYSSGQSADYVRLESLLRPLRENCLPLHLSLGNHDHRDRFVEALRWAVPSKAIVVRKQVSVIESPLANWFLLDSLDETNATPGLLGTEQLGWLARSLDENASKPAVVFVHHNPGLSGNLGLKDTVALMEILRPRRQVKAYVYGHTHTWSVEKDTSGLYMVNLPAVSYTFAAGQPTGWVHAELAKDGMHLRLRCLDMAHSANGESRELVWRT